MIRHENLRIPESDVLIHSGDIGTRTDLQELDRFLNWFDRQPATHKVWIAGNHDLCLDARFMRENPSGLKLGGISVFREAMEMVKQYNAHYLMNNDCTIEGLRFFGAPWSPSFQRHRWAFNQDPGAEIQKQWSRIPSDTDVLITHSPPFGCLDQVAPSHFEVSLESQHVG
ncbi:MAG: metallophosphoesterase family protein, partial [Sphingobacterium sp.]